MSSNANSISECNLESSKKLARTIESLQRNSRRGLNYKTEHIILGKIIINILSGWSEEYGDGQFLLEAMNRWSGPRKWVSYLDSLRDKFLETATVDEKRYAPPRHWVNAENIGVAISLIQEELPEVNEPWPFRSGTIFLGEYLELTETEMKIVDLACRFSDNIEYDNRCILSKIAMLEGCSETIPLFSRSLDVPPSEIKKFTKSFLFNSGILTPCHTPSGFFTLNDELSECFSLENLDAETLDNMMFPSNLKTELTVDSYPHLKSEIALSESIINASLAKKQIGTNIMLWGIPGTGKTELAIALAKKNGWNLKVIGDNSSNDMNEKSRSTRLASLKIAMKLFSRDPTAVLLFDEMGDLCKSDNNAAFSKAFINRIIETTPVPILWTTNDLEPVGGAALRRMVYNIGFEVPPVAAREEMWRRCSERYNVGLDDKSIEKFAVDFDIAPALMDNAMKIASLSECTEEQIPEVVSSLDRLVRFGNKRKTETTTISDTPYDVKCANTDIDLDDMTRKLMAAKPRFSLCLYGRPGTGKSEYARYLAKQMGKKVLFKRGSDLISKYVGDTERLIAAAFDEARQSEKVLIIDEGDSFLRNREYAKQSWEVTEVNEMLSQMEAHTQPFVMTTNLMKDLDPAALRRFTFKLSFEFLTKEQARKLFKMYFGVEPPQEIDRNDILAPGDFSNVKRRADILGVTDAAALYEMLCVETRHKPQNRNSMGFGA